MRRKSIPGRSRWNYFQDVVYVAGCGQAALGRPTCGSRHKHAAFRFAPPHPVVRGDCLPPEKRTLIFSGGGRKRGRVCAFHERSAAWIFFHSGTLTAEPSSDFSVGMTWGFKADHWYLLDCRRARLDFPDLKREVLSQANRWSADIVLIELAGSGISLFQQLRQDDRRAWRYAGTQPLLDKITRLEAQTARLETGRYLLPDQAPWLDELRRELLAFPMGKYNDQVDALTQFVEWAASPRGEARQRRNPVTGRPILVRRQSIARPMR